MKKLLFLKEQELNFNTKLLNEHLDTKKFTNNNKFNLLYMVLLIKTFMQYIKLIY